MPAGNAYRNRFKAKSPYILDGVPIPGVTSIISRNDGSGAEGLRGWAVGLALKGINPDEYTKSRARIGSLMHAMIAHDMTHETYHPLPFPVNTESVVEEWQEATLRYNAWGKWWAGLGGAYGVWGVEEPLMGRVTNDRGTFAYGGTPDGILTYRDEFILIDYKSKLSVIKQYLIQLAAYKVLWDSQHPDRPITSALLISPQPNGSVDTRAVSHQELAENTRVWWAMLELDAIRRNLEGK